MTAPAPTYIEPHWYTGILKCRCSRCHKVVFESEARAHAAATQISARTPMFAYFSRRCGHWHLSRQAPKGQAAR